MNEDGWLEAEFSGHLRMQAARDTFLRVQGCDREFSGHLRCRVQGSDRGRVQAGREEAGM